MLQKMTSSTRLSLLLSDDAPLLFTRCSHTCLYEILGAHLPHNQGVDGVCFADWAPNARRVSEVGDFNQWDGSRQLKRVRGLSEIWTLSWSKCPWPKK